MRRIKRINEHRDTETRNFILSPCLRVQFIYRGNVRMNAKSIKPGQIFSYHSNEYI